MPNPGIQPLILLVYDYLFLLAYQHSASNPICLLVSALVGLPKFSLESYLFTHFCSCWLTSIQPRILLLSYCCFTSIQPRILLPSQSGISIIQPTGLQPGILLAGLALYLLAGLQLAVRHPDHPLQARS